MEVSGQSHAPAALHSRKYLRITIQWGVGWAPRRFDFSEKRRRPCALVGNERRILDFPSGRIVTVVLAVISPTQINNKLLWRWNVGQAALINTTALTEIRRGSHVKAACTCIFELAFIPFTDTNRRVKVDLQWQGNSILETWIFFIL